MFHRNIICTFAILLLLSLVSGIAHAEDYEIKLERPYKVGDKYQVKGTLKQDRTISVTQMNRPMPADTDKINVRFDFTEEILEVNERGEPMVIRMTFEEFVNIEAGGTSDILDSGTVVTAEHLHGKQQYRLQVGRLSDEAVNVLDAIVEVGPKHVSDDEVFGTDQKQSPSSSWDMNKEAAIEGCEKNEYDMKNANIDGTARFVGVQEVEGVSCMELNLNMEMTGHAEPIPGLPAGMKVQESKVKVDAVVFLPVDGTSVARRSTGTTSSKSILLGDFQGVMLRFQFMVDREHDYTRIPVQ